MSKLYTFGKLTGLTEDGKGRYIVQLATDLLSFNIMFTNDSVRENNLYGKELECFDIVNNIIDFELDTFFGRWLSQTPLNDMYTIYKNMYTVNFSDSERDEELRLALNEWWKLYTMPAYMLTIADTSTNNYRTVPLRPGIYFPYDHLYSFEIVSPKEYIQYPDLDTITIKIAVLE